MLFYFFFSSRRRHTRYIGDWSSDVCSSDLREALHRTEGLLFSSPRPLARQLVAAWLAGVLMAMALGAGVGARLAATGDVEIGRASCRERVEVWEGAGSVERKRTE